MVHAGGGGGDHAGGGGGHAGGGGDHTNEQCAGDLVIVENEGEGARCQDSSVSDSEHIEGTNAKHGAITSEQDDKTG